MVKHRPTPLLKAFDVGVIFSNNELLFFKETQWTKFSRLTYVFLPGNKHMDEWSSKLFVHNKTLEMPLVSDVQQCRPILYSSTDSDWSQKI